MWLVWVWYILKDWQINICSLNVNEFAQMWIWVWVLAYKKCSPFCSTLLIYYYIVWLLFSLPHPSSHKNWFFDENLTNYYLVEVIVALILMFELVQEWRRFSYLRNCCNESKYKSNFLFIEYMLLLAQELGVIFWGGRIFVGLPMDSGEQCRLTWA